MLGPDCVLVHRTPGGFRGLARNDAARLQKCALNADCDAEWLFRQSQRIADALNKGEIALAQIYGLHIPVGELTERQLRSLALARLAKDGFDPDEPRVPAGSGRESGNGPMAVEATAPMLLLTTAAELPKITGVAMTAAATVAPVKPAVRRPVGPQRRAMVLVTMATAKPPKRRMTLCRQTLVLPTIETNKRRPTTRQ